MLDGSGTIQRTCIDAFAKAAEFAEKNGMRAEKDADNQIMIYRDYGDTARLVGVWNDPSQPSNPKPPKQNGFAPEIHFD